MSDEPHQPQKPNEERPSGLPRGQFFSDDQTGLPEGEPISPLKIGCMALGLVKVGCLLFAILSIILAMVLARL